jgi:hypothetical protein
MTYEIINPTNKFQFTHEANWPHYQLLVEMDGDTLLPRRSWSTSVAVVIHALLLPYVAHRHSSFYSIPMTKLTKLWRSSYIEVKDVSLWYHPHKSKSSSLQILMILFSGGGGEQTKPTTHVGKNVSCFLSCWEISIEVNPAYF